MQNIQQNFDRIEEQIATVWHDYEDYNEGAIQTPQHLIINPPYRTPNNLSKTETRSRLLQEMLDSIDHKSESNVQGDRDL